MSKASLGIGNVEIDLDGEKVVLRPTLKAAQTISRLNGGILGAVEAVVKFDLETITSVVALGLGKEPKDVADRVFEAGIANLAPAVVRYLTIIANGGRPSGGEEAADPR